MERGKIGSSGRPVVGADVRILVPGGGFDDEAPSGETGEIAISGPSLAIGYWKDRELTREKFRDGWWRSGDLGRLDADNYLWVSGRIDNVINTGGIKVSGEEIEHALLAASRHRAMRRRRPARPAAGTTHRGLSRRPGRAGWNPAKSTCSCAGSAISPATRFRRRFTGSTPCRPARPESCFGARCGRMGNRCRTRDVILRSLARLKCSDTHSKPHCLMRSIGLWLILRLAIREQMQRTSDHYYEQFALG